MTVVREVIRGEAHTRLHGAFFVESYTGSFPNFREGAVVVVVVKKVCRSIACDINIRPAVVVEIRRQRRETITPRSFFDSGVFRNIRERAVAVIVVQRIYTHFESSRSAHNVYPFPFAPLPLSRPRHRVVTEIHVARHKKIGSAIAVIIQKTTSGTPLWLGSLQPCFFGY